MKQGLTNLADRRREPEGHPDGTYFRRLDVAALKAAAGCILRLHKAAGKQVNGLSDPPLDLTRWYRAPVDPGGAGSGGAIRN
jgi:hypothetical protein